VDFGGARSIAGEARTLTFNEGWLRQIEARERMEKPLYLSELVLIHVVSKYNR
jgi:hypothetical protein